MKKNTNNLPVRFMERCAELFGSYYFEKMKNTFVHRPVTFRVNVLQANKEEILTILQEKGFKLKRVSWYGDAFILQNKSKKQLSELDMYKTGKIYLQSLASMVPVLILDPKPGEKILDLTAAPGSKTSQIAAFTGKRGELVANEIDEVRFSKLAHNMKLLGVADGDYLKLKQQDGAKLCLEYPAYFDKILLDAPCGAEARIVAEDVRSYGFWSEKRIKDISYRQRKLLFSAWSALKRGGTLVYSTCTFAPEENEEQIERIMKKFTGEIKVKKIDLKGLETAPHILEWKGWKFSEEIQNCLRLLPTKEIEGFFAAKLIKI